jgi:voltage-gated potassium channel
MSKKVLIMGYGSVGREIARNIQLPKEQIYVVEIHAGRLGLAKEDGFEAYSYDLTEDQNLLKLGIGDDVTDFFCVGGDEEINLFVTFAARTIDKNVRILARAEDADAKKKLTLAGANETIDFNETGANKIFNLLKKPKVLSFMEKCVYDKYKGADEESLGMAELMVVDDSTLIGKRLYQIDFKNEYDLVALGIHGKKTKKGFIFSFAAYNHTIEAGDVIVAIGIEENMSRFRLDMGYLQTIETTPA